MVVGVSFGCEIICIMLFLSLVKSGCRFLKSLVCSLVGEIFAV